MEKARVVWIFVKGDFNNVKKYSPIALLSYPSTLLETLVYPIVTLYLDKHITSHQHGFRNERSIQTHLVSFISDLAYEIDNDNQVLCIPTIVVHLAGNIVVYCRKSFGPFSISFGMTSFIFVGKISDCRHFLVLNLTHILLK